MNLPHTDPHCHLRESSTLVPSQICWYITEASTSTDFDDEELVAPGVYDFIFIDGGALIHSLPGTSASGKTFDYYFDKVICPRVHYELKRTTRVDIVWGSSAL